MQSFLIFSLTASLGAMGELAGHERRGSLTWPARSALIGLLGAALGIRRDGDFSVLDALEIDVAIFDAGAPMRDYHTVGTVPSAVVKSPNSRPEALLRAASRTSTTITLRDYRAGALYGVAVRGGGIDVLETALKAPRFTLYLGRKACPLAAPTGARIVQAESSEAALARLVLPPWRRVGRTGDPVSASILVSTNAQGEIVHDIPIDRRQWHFAPRRVALRPVRIVPEDSA